jgi:hypothetical protein
MQGAAGSKYAEKKPPLKVDHMKLSDRIVLTERPEQVELSSLTDDLKKWSEWLRSIESAVTELCVGREVYKETLDMYRQNPAIQKPSLFYSWMRGLFVAWSVTLIGRLVDDKRGTRSFVRFLRSVQKSSHPPSRDHHVALYITAMTNFSDEEAARIANREFDRLVGSTENFVPKRQVEVDIARLLEVTKPIIRFRHERVAHVAENPSEQLPTYENLDAGIIVLVELLRKYSLLINGVSADPFPTIQYDWLAIFRVPWIVESK